MTQSAGAPISSLMDEMERQIEAEVENLPSIHGELPITYAPRNVRSPSLSMSDATTIPDYVEHTDGATEIGKLSAEAIVREYEAAAKDIEAMGVEMIERVKHCETMTRNALAVTEEMKDTARAAAVHSGRAPQRMRGPPEPRRLAPTPLRSGRRPWAHSSTCYC